MTNQIETRRQLAALLEWYATMGADDIVAEGATNWLQRCDVAPGADLLARFEKVPANALPAAANVRRNSDAGPPQPNLSARTRVPSSAYQGSGDEAVMAARAAAGAAQSLSALRDLLLQFDGCGLKATAKNLCFYRGSERSDLMIVGEAPGRDEDIAGLPFVGRAGQLLDKMLDAIGLNEPMVHITNVVYWRPPGNRTPSLHETEVCRPFLDRQVGLVAPRIILLLGGAAAKTIYRTSDGIMRLRGKWREVEFDGQPVKTLATLHPAFLLRSPGHKRLAWRDLLAVQAALADGPAS